MLERLSQIRSNRVVRNVIALGLGQGANYLLPLASIPFLLHTLGPSGYGQLAFAQATMAFFSIVVAYGFNMNMTKEVAENRDRRDYVASLNATVIGLQLLFAGIGFLILLLLCALVPAISKSSTVFLIAYIGVFGGVFSARYLFQGYENMQAMTIVDVSARAIGVLLLFVFVRSEDDVALAMFLLCSGSLFAPIAFTVLVVRSLDIPFAMPKWRYAVEQMREGWVFFVSSVSGVLFNQGNVVILGFMLPSASVGIYAAAEKVVKAAATMNVPITQAVYPNAMRVAAEGKEKFVRYLRRLLLIQPTLMALPSIFLLVFGFWIANTVLGVSDPNAAYVLMIMAVLPLSQAFADILGIIAMLGNGYKRQFTSQIVAVGVFNLALLFCLVPVIGLIGAALSVVVTELTLALMRFRFVRKRRLLTA